MRRAQSVRHYARSSLALAVDDLGTLKEGDESNEDVLRRQLLDKDRENDKVKRLLMLWLNLLTENAAAYPTPNASGPALWTSASGESSRVREGVQEFGLDLARHTAGEWTVYGGAWPVRISLLQAFGVCWYRLAPGSARRCSNVRLRSSLGRTGRFATIFNLYSSANDWLTLCQSSLDIAPSTNTNRFHQRSATISSSPILTSLTSSLRSNSSPTPTSTEQPNRQAMLAHVEQVRLLILGMEQRLQTREEKLTKTMEKAESESRRFEELQQELATRLWSWQPRYVPASDELAFSHPLTILLQLYTIRPYM